MNDPQQTTVPAHGFLIIWADNDTGDNGLHAGFGLSAAGECLALYAADGHTPVDSVEFFQQLADISYGRSPGDPARWHYMDRPSPGQTNQAGFVGLVSQVRFSRHRGFYSQAVTVEMTAEPPDATIRYFLDGSDPSGSIDALVYTGPLTITTTTCLRAYASRQDYLPSRVETPDLYLYRRRDQPISATGTRCRLPALLEGGFRDF